MPGRLIKGACTSNGGSGDVERHDHVGQRATFQELDKLLLAFDDDAAAAATRFGRMAHEVQRVAETLFGIEQDGASFELLAAPAWLFEAAVGEDFGLPAPFVFLEAAGQVAVAHSPGRPGQMGVGQLGVDPHRLVVAAASFCRHSQGVVRGAEIVVRFGRVRIELDRPFENRNGFLVAAGVSNRGAEIGIGAGVVGIGGNGLLEQFDGLVQCVSVRAASGPG